MPRFYKEIKKDGKVVDYLPVMDEASTDSSDKIISMTSPQYIYEKLALKLTGVDERTHFFETASALLNNLFVIARKTTNANEREKTLLCIQTILDAYRSIIRSNFYSPKMWFGSPTDNLPTELAEFCRDTLYLKLPTALDKGVQLQLNDSLVIDQDRYQQLIVGTDILRISPRSSSSSQ